MQLNQIYESLRGFSIIEQIGWTLLHFLWQGTVLALLASSLLWLMRRHSSAARYVTALTLMAMMAICPIITFLNLSQGSGTLIAGLQVSEESRAVAEDTPAPATILNNKTLGTFEVADLGPIVIDPLNTAHFETKFESATFAIVLFVVVWFTGVTILSIRLLLSLLGIRSLRRHTLDPPVWVRGKCRSIAKSMSIRSPAIAISTRVTEAIATGFLKPMVLLPASWISELPPDMLEAIIAHELAHIRRGDLWTNLFQRVVETLLFYHPAVWWISNRIRTERELCCDAMVVSKTKNALRYAETLEFVGRLSLTPDPKPLAVASIGSQRVLLNRISSVLYPPKHDRARSTWLAGLVPLLLVIVIAVSLLPATSDAVVLAADEVEGDLNVTVLEASGDKTSDHVYLTLWKAIGGEEELKNTVNGPNGFGYYTPVVWNDTKSGVRWKRFRNAHPNDGRHSSDGVRSFRFESLPAGMYRVTAVSYRRKATVPDPSPFAVSELFSVDGNRLREIKLRFIKGTAGLRLKLIDAATKSPISNVALRLRTQEGMPIVHGHGSGNFFERSGEQGKVEFASLPSGEYLIEVLGKGAGTGESIEYPPLENLVSVEVASKGQQLEIPLPPRKLLQTEIDKRNPFSIIGRVTDGDGNPLANIELRAATGIGTLIGGGSTKTDANGNYKLYFGPGMRTQVSDRVPLGIGVQAVHLYLQGDDWSLNGDEGYLFYLMTDQSPDQFSESLKAEGKIWSKSDTSEVVFANTPKEVNLMLSRSKADDDEEKNDDSIVWGISRNGLIAGAKLLSASGKLQPGDPVVVQFVLKNESDKEQTVVLQHFDSPHPVLGESNRLELNLTGRSQQRQQHTLSSGEIMEESQYRVNVSTEGMLAGEYSITSGSAFWMVKAGEPNRATGIPFRRQIPFMLGNPSKTNLAEPPVDDIPEWKTHWGEPAGQLVLGMRMLEGRESWPDDGVDIEGQLFLFNAGTEAVKLKYDLPPTPADWNMHVTSRDNDNYVRLDSTWFTGIEPSRTVDLTLKAGESVPVTGVRYGVSTGGKAAVEELVGGPMLRIMKEKTEFNYGDPKRLIDQRGRFSFHAALSISIEGLSDPQVIASSAPVPFEVVEKKDE